MTDDPDTPRDEQAVFSNADGMDLKTIQEHWTYLNEEEHRAFEACVELDNDNPDRTQEKAAAVRHWWSVTSAILWFYVRTRCQFDIDLTPFPAYNFARLANISEELAAGNVPSFVINGRKAGRPMWLRERHHIAHAVFYIEAAKRGEIKDAAYNKTVREAFGVSANAVRGWLGRRDEICVGVPVRHLTPAMIARKMRESGAIYTRIGRGATQN